MGAPEQLYEISLKNSTHVLNKNMKRQPPAILIIIVITATVAGFFVYPGSVGSKYLPWNLGLDLIGGAHLVYDVDVSNVSAEDEESVLSGLRDVIERRVNLFGVSEPQVVVAKNGESRRLIVELAGIDDVAQAIAEIGEVPTLVFAELDQSTISEDTQNTDDISFLPTNLTGRYIVGAQLSFDNVTGSAEVSLEFNDEGAQIFEELTGRNVGLPVGVILDGTLITAPVVQGVISGGRAQITGNFTLDEARLLVSRFNAGALPAPIMLIGQQTVGASLGANSLKQTVYAGIVVTLLVMLFMILYYRSFGVYASLALIMYIIFTLLVFKGFGITLTLAGIAGIVLSIGMAVDANILIFERTREELQRGSPYFSAIEEGFKRAWLSIRDSNITTIITSVILFYFTTGFIKGFALALLIGVLVSMFSAITITRTMLRVFTKQK